MSSDTKILSVVSWNLCADFFTDKHSTDKNPINWKENRLPVFLLFLTRYSPDILALQELSTQQCEDLRKYCQDIGYTLVASAQHPAEVPIDRILLGEDITEQVGKFAGTPLLAFLVKSKIQILLDQCGRKWFNDTPDALPKDACTRGTDKGFGNMQTNRCIFYITVKYQNKEIVLFNSHYPLSGNCVTRSLCAELENKICSEVSNGRMFVSCGDRNFFDDHDVQEIIQGKICNAEFCLDKLTKGFHNALEEEYYGYNTTFLGYHYDEWRNIPIVQNGVVTGFERNDHTDVIFSSHKSCFASVLHGGYSGSELLDQLSPITKQIVDSTSFISDHCAVYAKYEIS